MYMGNELKQAMSKMSKTSCSNCNTTRIQEADQQKSTILEPESIQGYFFIENNPNVNFQGKPES